MVPPTPPLLLPAERIGALAGVDAWLDGALEDGNWREKMRARNQVTLALTLLIYYLWGYTLNRVTLFALIFSIGILVDERLQTSVSGVFSAGDVAQGPVFDSRQREVHAIQPTAAEHGRIAALNMLGIDAPYRGSLAMNVLNTLGLVSCSYGQWMGVEGGDQATALDAETFRYLRLEFRDDVLVGAIGLGVREHVGVLRGLIQSSLRLGDWKARLLEDPNQIAAAYLECARR